MSDRVAVPQRAWWEKSQWLAEIHTQRQQRKGFSFVLCSFSQLRKNCFSKKLSCREQPNSFSFYFFIFRQAVWKESSSFLQRMVWFHLQLQLCDYVRNQLWSSYPIELDLGKREEGERRFWKTGGYNKPKERTCYMFLILKSHMHALKVTHKHTQHTQRNTLKKDGTNVKNAEKSKSAFNDWLFLF